MTIAESDISQAIPVGVDDGYAQTKVCSPDPASLRPDVPGLPLVIPSRGRTGPASMGGAEGDVPPSVYRCGHELVTVDAGLIDPEETRGEQYKTSALNRAVVFHALYRAGLDEPAARGRGLCLVTGLPYSRYFTAVGTRDNAQIEAKTLHYQQPVVRLNESPIARIVWHTVSPEAVAALAAHNVETRNPGGRWSAVIDIGGQTTDILLVTRNTDGVTIDHAHSATAPTAMLSVHDYMRQKIPGLSRRACEDALRQFTHTQRALVRLERQDQDISELVADSLAAVGAVIGRQADRLLAAASADIDLILVAGGGADALGRFLRIRGVEIVNDPQTANARGFFYKARERIREGRTRGRA